MTGSYVGVCIARTVHCVPGNLQRVSERAAGSDQIMVNKSVCGAASYKYY
jgi:hypothetical protein